jgi:serine/threonine-protein kinase
MAIPSGTRVGGYEVIAPLGEGGMGTVYRARDTRLNRDVALKLLPDTFSQDADRAARFMREAQVLASLNHPNIAAIYGLEPIDGEHAIVMELVEGDTLDARVARGPLPPDDVRRIGRQIADALDAAHDRGIVHRDLKPANVIVRPDGTVKVLDFGLAKTQDLGALVSPDLTAAATISGSPATNAGMVLGTAPYMSPEQARGKPVDKRTDIWALGCLLYELFTGHRAFEGATMSDTMAMVLTRDPDWSRLTAAHVPPRAIDLIARCLRKDPRQRVQSAGDARIALEEFDQNAVAAVPSSRRAPIVVLAASALLFVGALAVLVYTMWGRRSESAPPSSPVRAVAALPTDGTMWFEDGVSLAFSRDGGTLAWVGGSGSARRLWVRAADQLDGRPLPGTEGATNPFFSPDGQWLGFFDDGALKKVSVSGQNAPVAITIATDRGRGGAWGEDGTIVFSASSDSALDTVSAAGGPATPLTRLETLNAATHRFPVFVPGRRAVVYALGTRAAQYNSSVAAVDLDTGIEKVVLENAAQPAFLPTGDLLFLRDAALYLVGFDPESLSTRGQPIEVLAGVLVNTNSRSGQFATGGGRLAYVSGSGIAENFTVIEWRPLTGAPRLLLSTPDSHRDLRFSPDGRRLAYAAFPRGARSTDMWVYDLQRDVKVLLGSGLTAQWRPVWTPDGRHIVYADFPGGMNRIRSDGSGQPEQLTQTAQSVTQAPTSISSDGRFLAYHEYDAGQTADIWILPLDPPGPPFRFFSSPAMDTLPMFSPDGKWIAYASDESGSTQLYVRPFPKADAKWQVSSTGSLDEHGWSRDGGKLYFRSGDGMNMMMATVTTTGGALEIGRATSVLTLSADEYPELSFWGGMALSPDDKGFALAKYAERVIGDRSRIVLWLDWIDAVKRGAAVPR